MLMRRQRGRRVRQAGLSIVELMVGVTIGLIVVAAASLLMSTQLVENRKLLLEAQLQQDLRATADIITREFRRAGALPESRASAVPAVIDTVWTATEPGAKKNTLLDRFGLDGAGYFTFNYWPPSTTTVLTPFGFKLDSGVIKTYLLGGSAQSLTDGGVMTVTSFSFTPRTVSSAVTRIPCPKACPDGTGNCWPKVEVRNLGIRIEAKSARDGSVWRAVNSSVRVRNDTVGFFDANNICPP